MMPCDRCEEEEYDVLKRLTSWSADASRAPSASRWVANHDTSEASSRSGIKFQVEAG
jgi:hypothetical protein